MVAHFRTCDSQSYGLASPRGVSSFPPFLDGLIEQQHSKEAEQSEDSTTSRCELARGEVQCKPEWLKAIYWSVTTRLSKNNYFLGKALSRPRLTPQAIAPPAAALPTKAAPATTRGATFASGAAESWEKESLPSMIVSNIHHSCCR
jgi:hypothetical protein